MISDITVRPWTRVDYQRSLLEMQEFTANREPDTPDEIWLVEHPSVFTLGLAAKPEHLLNTGNIPVIQTERGGQVTYHGPGQVVAYLLLDIARRRLGIRELVNLIEEASINLLAAHNIGAQRRDGAPGVFVQTPSSHEGSKIAALGLKVSRGRTFHGMALNVAMDLAPFSRINPCGYAGMAVTDMQSISGPKDSAQVADQLSAALIASLDNAQKAKKHD
jgi:lipoyl(octanoyl) transferase